MDFNPETAVIGGMSLIVLHQVIMAQIRKFIPDWKQLDRFFDLLNYPVAFILILLINPPWPIYSATEWQEYIAYSLATSALASISAAKILVQEKKTIQKMEVEQALQTPPREAELRPIVRKER